MFKRKSKVGAATPKTVDRDAINREYNQLAAKVGHSARLVSELQSEIEGHVNRLTVLAAQAVALPPVATATEPTPAQEPV